MTTRTTYAGIGIWMGVVAGGAIIAALLGAALTLASAALVLIVGVVPPIIMLKVWNSTPAETVAEMLRSTDQKV
jgi:hypothetical protein